jgi:ATP-dependent Clp protease ATP-binding subunit ClpA
MFSRALERTLHEALAYANQRDHEYATLEHLLLALIDDADASAVMNACKVDLAALKEHLTNYINNELKDLVTDGSKDAQPTAGFQRVVQRAVIHVQSTGREEVTGPELLVAMFAERESPAVYFLQEQDMTRFDAVNYIGQGIAKAAETSLEQGVVRQSFSHGRTKRSQWRRSNGGGGPGMGKRPKMPNRSRSSWPRSNQRRRLLATFEVRMWRRRRHPPDTDAIEG